MIGLPGAYKTGQAHFAAITADSPPDLIFQTDDNTFQLSISGDYLLA